MRIHETKKQYVVCIRNEGYLASLVVRRVYESLPDPDVSKRGLLRVFDESGEDYLYPKDFFVAIALPKAAAKAFSPAAQVLRSQTAAPIERREILEEYRTDLTSRLQSVYNALSRTTFVAKILDKDWYEAVSEHIEKAELSRAFDSALMFVEMDHPLRGVHWFEKIQDLVEEGRASELEQDQKFALRLFGTDPLRTFLPILEERLRCFASLPFKHREVRRKLKELRAIRFKRDFRNHLFEVSVLGFFAKQGVLTDIEIPVGQEQGTVDGEINIDGRPILVEVTFTSQELLRSEPGVFAVPVEPFIDQVVCKIRKKVASGRQLALARGNPSILFIGRNRHGADRITSKLGIQECFADPDFARLSAVIVSDTWKLLRTEFHVAPDPELPLSRREIETLRAWFGT